MNGGNVLMKAETNLGGVLPSFDNSNKLYVHFLKF